MEPVEFIAVKEEDISDNLIDYRVENNCLTFDPFESEERKQELTDALRYCLDLLKDAQVISDLQNNHGSISKRSQLMGKEIRRRIMDMMYSMEFTEDEEDVEVIECKEEPLFHSLGELSCDLNSEKEQENDSTKFLKIKHKEIGNAKYKRLNKIRTKQTRLSIEDRVKILERLDKGEKVGKLAREYKISNSAVLYMRKYREHLIKKRASIIMFQGKTTKKRCTGIENSRLEQTLYKWFLQKKSIGDTVTKQMLSRKALDFNKLFNDTKNFKASNGFVDKFKKRHNIKCVTNEEKLFVVDQYANGNFHRDFTKYIIDNKIPIDKVYNADEAGFYWKELPDLVTNSEHQALGTKLVRDRVTLMVCTNATGSHKLPLFIVGKTYPHYLKNIRSLPIIYMRQKNAWMDKQLMSRWYREVFLPEIERFHGSNDERCLLLLDNAPNHLLAEHFNSISKRCQVMFLSPNVTALVQPMNQGIIENLKKMYRKNLLKVILTVKTNEDIPKLLKSLDILKCCYLVNDAWDEVTEINIKNGWKNIFPFHSVIEQNFDSPSLLDIAIKIPGYSKITSEEINSWLHSDDNEQGWQVLDDRELAFPEECENDIDQENEEKEEENNEHLNDNDTASDITAKNALNAISLFMAWYKNQDTPQDSQYLRKFRERTLDRISLIKRNNKENI